MKKVLFPFLCIVSVMGCFFDPSGKVAPAVSPVCGNSVVQAGESCDGTDFGDQTCESRGYASGTLSCRDDCTVNESACIPVDNCGNGDIDGEEECDGNNLDEQTCEELGYGGGTLSCNQNCTLNEEECTPTVECGDGNLDSGEECDEGANNSNIVPDACRLNCRNPSCGDIVVDSGEECDDGGTTPGDGCDAFCQIELFCGDGSVDLGESCDGSDLGIGTCENQGFPGGGVLGCESDCTFDTSQCVFSLCGNGTVDTSEDCDSDDVDGETCQSQGYTGGGILGCINATCSFDFSGCSYLEDCDVAGDEDDDGYSDCFDQDCAGHASCTSQQFCSQNCVPSACQNHQYCAQYNVSGNDVDCQGSSAGQPCTMGAGLTCASGTSTSGECAQWQDICVCNPPEAP